MQLKIAYKTFIKFIIRRTVKNAQKLSWTIDAITR